MLHDALAHYEPDIEIADVDEPRPRQRRQRPPTDEALTMQVLIDGLYHRRLPDLSMTSCAKPIASQFSPLRRESLTGKLCPECFTPFELRKAAEHTARERDLGDKP